MSTDERIVFPLTEYVTRTAERGRGSGNTITDRWVLMRDNRNFYIAVQNNKTIIGKKFASKIEHLIPMIKSELGIPMKETFEKLSDILSKEEGVSYTWDNNKSMYENLAAADRMYNPFGLFPGKEYLG